MFRKFSLSFLGLLSLLFFFSLTVPQVATTFAIGNSMAAAIVNFIVSASNIATAVSLVGVIIWGRRLYFSCSTNCKIYG